MTTSRSAHTDWVAAAGLFAAGLYVIIETRGYPGSPVPGAPGPAFFPQLLAGLLMVLSVGLAVSAYCSWRSGSGEVIQWEGLSKITLVICLSVVYLALLPIGDFYLLTPPLLAAIMAIMGERRAQYLTLVPLGFVTFVYVVFYLAFGVELPSIFL